MNTTTEMQLVSIDKLIPYINNARTHSPEQIKKLRASLREFGFINPVIIDKDFNVIAGHGRLLAAKEEGITEVPCVFVDYLTEAQKKAYIIADNRMAMDAGWDEELLRVEIEALQAEAFDLSLTGFDDTEIADLSEMIPMCRRTISMWTRSWRSLHSPRQATCGRSDGTGWSAAIPRKRKPSIFSCRGGKRTSW